MTRRFKVVKEYKNFYLCEDERGIKECFKKGYHHPDESGFIYKKETDYIGGEAKRRTKPSSTHPFHMKFTD